MQTTINVTGMTCKNCEKAVNDVLLDIDGVTDVSVNLADGAVVIDHSEAVDVDQFNKVVEEQGYEVK